jgi:hypothetical protein
MSDKATNEPNKINNSKHTSVLSRTEGKEPGAGGGGGGGKDGAVLLLPVTPSPVKEENTVQCILELALALPSTHGITRTISKLK